MIWAKKHQCCLGQISARMAQELGANQDYGLAILGAMHGGAQPDGRGFRAGCDGLRALQQGQMGAGLTGDRSVDVESADDKKVEWILERECIDKIIACSRKADQTELDKDVGLVFQRMA